MAEFFNPTMDDATALNERIKSMLVENLMLQLTSSDIADDQPLFGPGSLGLDSVDALQLVVALDKNFGLKIPDPATARSGPSTMTLPAPTSPSKVACRVFRPVMNCR